MRTTLLILFAVLACNPSPTRPPAADALGPLTALPAELQPLAHRGTQAITALRAALGARLGQELEAHGPTGAVVVCRDEAPRITAQIQADRGVRVGRTSARLRNRGNTSPPWLAPHVAATATAPAAAAEILAVDLGDRVAVAVPIPSAKPCLTCHGPRAQIPEEIRGELAKSYPKDEAVDFTVGSLRGYFWAEVPKVPAN